MRDNPHCLNLPVRRVRIAQVHKRGQPDRYRGIYRIIVVNALLTTYRSTNGLYGVAFILIVQPKLNVANVTASTIAKLRRVVNLSDFKADLERAAELCIGSILCPLGLLLHKAPAPIHNDSTQRNGKSNKKDCCNQRRNAFLAAPKDATS